MARPLTIFRRCGLRSVILGLGVVYFLAMYIFHSDLQLSGVAPREGWDKLEIGGDAGDASLHKKGSRPTPRDEDRQRVFDRMQLNERGKKDGKESNADSAILEERLNPEANVNRILAAIKNERGKTVPSMDDVNIPVGCGKDPENADEFSFRSIASDVFVYSAFWDSRPNDFDNRRNGSFIRIMTIIRGSARPELNCTFQVTDHKDGSAPPLTSRIGYYEMCENHGRVFGGFILSCPVPPSISSPTCAVTIGAIRSGVVAETVRIRIRTTDPVRRPRLNFSICVPPLFGSLNVARLVEFLEVSRILGADHVTMYDFELSPEVKVVLDYYARKTGFVSVVPWRLDRSIDTGIWYHGQLVSIQDCLYRNMASADHVAFNDIDEFIVPQKSPHWSGMLQTLDDPKRCAFQFKSAFFKPSTDKQELDIQTLNTFERTSNFDKVRTKCMVKAFSIFEKGIHHVSKPIWADLQVHPVEVEVAFLHHYRVCLHGMGMNCGGYEQDKTMLRYREEIVSAVNASNYALKRIGVAS